MISIRDYYNNVVKVKHNELLIYATSLKHDQFIDKLDNIIQGFNDNVIYEIPVNSLFNYFKNDLNDLISYFSCDYIERLVIKDIINEVEYIISQLPIKGVK